MSLSGFDVHVFRDQLTDWGRTHYRRYPWRETRNPYCILIAEVLLHRTRADQVVPLYNAVTRQFPSICSLAASDLREVTRILQSAGLRWRVELLHRMAGIACDDYRGEIPRSRSDLESLPGIGPYIAAAVRCFAFGEPDALLDTNTVRITGRLFSLTVTDASRRSQRFRVLLEELVDPMDPRGFNFSLLDLGALICVPGVPRCEVCPVLQHCAYGRKRLYSGEIPL